MKHSRFYQSFKDKVDEEVNCIRILHEGSKNIIASGSEEFNDLRSIYSARSKYNKQAYILTYSYLIEYFTSVFSWLIKHINIDDDVVKFLEELGKISLQFEKNETLLILKGDKSIYNIIRKKVTLLFRRKIEDKNNGKRLIKDFLKVLNIEANINQIDIFIEMRHLFVHNYGRPDKHFEDTYHAFVKDFPENLICFNGEYIKFIKNDKLPTDFEKLNIAIKHYLLFVENIDRQLVERFDVCT